MLTAPTTIEKGEIALLHVLLRAAERGAVASRPVREGSRYDPVIDENGRLSRAQVKYGGASRRAGSVVVELKKHSGGYRRHLYSYRRDELDALVVYMPSVGVVWLPPTLWVDRTSVTRRLAPARNGQATGCTFAADYLW